MSIGCSYELFFHLTPYKLKSFDLAWDNKRKIKDEEMWLHNKYTLEAFSVVMAHFGHGLGGKKGKCTSEYFKQPLLSNYDNNAEESDNEALAVYEMKQRIHMLSDMGLPESPK